MLNTTGMRRYEPRCLADILNPAQNSLGVIRLAMAIAVLISHSYFFVSGTPVAEPLHWLAGHSLGEHAVQVFFFLSGILVTESLLRSRNLVSFICGRVLRIFPGPAVCVFLTAIVLGPILSQKSIAHHFADPLWLTYIARTLFLTTGAAQLPGTFADLPAAGIVNLSLWTLKFEVLCYIGLAVVGAAGLLHFLGVRHGQLSRSVGHALWRRDANLCAAVCGARPEPLRRWPRHRPVRRTGFDTWVENGTAPDMLLATARKTPDVPWPGRTRPLCAHPKVATYKGSGDIESAASFECR